MTELNFSTAAGATGAAAGATVLSSSAVAQTATLGPKSTGMVGPGPNYAGLPDFKSLSTSGIENYETFGCKVYSGSPPTPDWATASVWFDRKIASTSITMPDGKIVDFWCFEDERVGSKSRGVPSAPIRVQQGDLVHVRLNSAKGSHTIHHHGIEPTTFNDGVGHVSMEVATEYMYQWEANTPGTWIYHCHVNTPLHFEMGLYGAVIVDPRPDANGKVRVFENGPLYDIEQIWVFDDVDPRWHLMEHAAGLCGDDVGLNVFEPKYFLVSGQPNRPGTALTKPRIVASPGKTVLIRMINAAYSQIRLKLPFDCEIVSADGHPLGKPETPWNRAMVVKAGEEIQMATAMRYDLIVKVPAGTSGKKFRCEFEFVDWISWKRHNPGDPISEGFAFTTIDVI